MPGSGASLAYASVAVLPALSNTATAYFAADTVNNVLDNPLALGVVGAVVLVLLLR